MATTSKKTVGFQAEVDQILNLMVHSLYSNKEIFLRELISNASDAADKLRFAALSNNKLYGDDIDLKVTIDCDKKAKTITITDNGIGMSHDEVMENLGTIAKSGTKEFLKSLTGDQAKDSQLIGQFGVGFYSAFIVADKVTVETRRATAKPEEGVRWESDGKSEYSIETIERAERGTRITLHLKKEEKEFLEDARLRNIVSKYSDHIGLPIHMVKPTDKKDDAPVYEAINQSKALWAMSRREIKDEQYKEFYKHISHDFADPLTWSHNQLEGRLNYTSLLYIPSKAPFDLFNREKPHGLKLYVQRVFIMDDAQQFLPNYLRFVKGVIDSSDLPLNISREILQSNPTTDKLRSALTKRVIDMLGKLANKDAEKYAAFWKEFGKVLKEGIAESPDDKSKLIPLLRFASTFADEATQNVSLDDYISRMQEGQDKIYFISADNFNAAKNSPHLEIFRKKGIEVILLSEPIDEWVVMHLTEYNDKKLQSVTQGNVDLGNVTDETEKTKQEEIAKEHESFIKQMKDALGDKVKDVRITHRLTESPACLVADEGGMNRQMQKMFAAYGQAMPPMKQIFEINPEHPLVKKLHDEQDDNRFKEWSHVLFDQAVLAEGGQLEDSAAFVHRLNRLLLDIK